MENWIFPYVRPSASKFFEIFLNAALRVNIFNVIAHPAVVDGSTLQGERQQLRCTFCSCLFQLPAILFHDNSSEHKSVEMLISFFLQLTKKE